MIYYWLDDKNVVQITKDQKVEEKALHRHGQVWSCNLDDVDLAVLLIGEKLKKNGGHA
jgi:hypothetical protein